MGQAYDTITPVSDGDVRTTKNGKAYTKFKASLPDGQVADVTVWATMDIRRGESIQGNLREDAPYKGNRQFSFTPVFKGGGVSASQGGAQAPVRPAPRQEEVKSQFSYDTYKERITILLKDAKAIVEDTFPGANSDTQAEIAERIAVHFSIAIDQNKVAAPASLMAKSVLPAQVAELKSRILAFANGNIQQADAIAGSFLNGIGKDWETITSEEWTVGMDYFRPSTPAGHNEIPF